MQSNIYELPYLDHSRIKESLQLNVTNFRLAQR